MLRYVKRQWSLALLAVAVSILAQAAMPVSAVLEQKMVDFIVQGDLDGFSRMLWFTALVVLLSGAAYF